MHEKSPGPKTREIVTAVAAGVLWALVGLALALSLGAAHASPTPAQLWGDQPRGADASKDAAGGSPSCRVFNQLPNGESNIGSGTLIDVKADRSRGLILTCAHLFTEGVGRVLVQFPNGKTHGALVIAQDSQADLAALEITSPSVTPASICLQLEPSANLRACGFGPSGEYGCATGQALGYSNGPGQQSLRMTGAVRSGDSGGGVFDSQGRLAAVVWGQGGDVTYASTGRPLQQFLARVLPGRAEVLAAKPVTSGTICPNGRCPLLGGSNLGVAPIQAPTIQSPTASAGTNGGLLGPSTTKPACSCDCDEKLKAITARVDALQQSKQDHGDYALRTDLAPLVKSDALAAIESEGRQRHEGLLERVNQLPATLGGAGRVAGVLATTALGISGPIGWGIIAASSVGGWLIGRRIKRKKSHASQLASAPEAAAVAEASFPVERDDREARELLRLSQLEGRDPLQDALAGRLALDRLDALAEGDADPQQADWADRLRRELRDRFNEIAPTKLSVK